MEKIKCMVKQFLSEPLWFKVLIISTLVSSILFSSSLFANRPIFESIAKFTAAIFFCTYAIKLRRKQMVSMVFFVLTALCIYFSWSFITNI